MKILKISFLALAVGSLLFFANCGGGDDNDGPSEKEKQTSILIDNSPWTLSAVTVPTGTAFEGEEAAFDNLSIVFSATGMTVTGIPAGATAIWPASSNWTANDDLSAITRAVDAVDMSVITLTETTFEVTFTLPEGTTTNERAAALDGEYRFTFTGSN